MKDTKPYVVPAYDHYYTEIVEGEYLAKEKALRILWVSDSPDDNDLNEYCRQRFTFLDLNKIERIYYDKPWHFTQDSSAYGLILIFFKD